MNQHTSIDTPSFEGPGDILVGATDILPTELREFQHSSLSNIPS